MSYETKPKVNTKWIPKVTVVNLYTDTQEPGSHREYCGRAGKGQEGRLGNPFVLNAEHNNRDRVCEQFEIYFKESMAYEYSALRKRVNELVEIAKTKHLELACFCQSPKDTVKKRCHCDIIKAHIEQQLESIMNKECRQPIVNQMDCIPSFRNELAFLSNMFESNVNGFKCAEAYFQANKVAGTEAYVAFLGLNGYEAKRLGRQVELRPDWNEVKLSIMEKILRIKFQGELLQKLLAVKGEIVERNNWGDTYWGIFNGKGENHLGKLLMKIRDEAKMFELSEYRQPVYTPENITELKPNEIFVFGSNTEGRHGKGAALIARQKFGAISSVNTGLHGQSYAIITKELRSWMPKIELKEIANGIYEMLWCAKHNQELTFLVTKIGCGLGGYTVDEIANLFVGLTIPDNVVLPKEFVEYLQIHKQAQEISLSTY